MPTKLKCEVKRIEVWNDSGGWNWSAKAGNGRVLTTSPPYARRNTAIRFLEQVTNAKRRGIPVFLLKTNGTERQLRY